MDPIDRRLAEIGLRAAARHGFALACGYAVEQTQRFGTFARLMVNTPDPGERHRE